ncbi:hypothetical protein HanRHA438_Chr14g0653841 [Helianthus annuus]|nr:hypothetical protein HanRHA438_Chr14g0653841 [Helianthus annuus]
MGPMHMHPTWTTAAAVMAEDVGWMRCMWWMLFLLLKLDSWEVVVTVVAVVVEFEVVASGGGGWFERWRTGGGRRRCFLRILSTLYVKWKKNVLLLLTVSCIFFLLCILKPFLLSQSLNSNTPFSL